MSISADDERRLEERLVLWEEARERGETLSAESLCRDCPELTDELKRRIQALGDWAGLESTSTEQTSAPSVGESSTVAETPAWACVTAQMSDLRFHDRGGLGTIYRARHGDLPRDVALKFIRQDRAQDPSSSRRFLREAEITARLEHPGIVPIYGLGRDEAGNPCYAMRFVQGTTLEQAINAYHARASQVRGRAPSETDRDFRALLQRFKSACTTVGYAHSRGVLHRDIKPANIMLGPFEETLVLDWGLGKIIGAEVPGSAGHHDPNDEQPAPGSDEIGTRGVIGTPGFMSPEQHAGEWEKVGPVSDVYSLGGTLYVLLTGRSPFPGRALGEIAAKVGRGEFLRPRQANPSIPRALEAVCLKAMALAAAERYRSALDLAGDLDNWLAGEPVTAWCEPWRVRARRWIGRHRALVTNIAIATLLLVIGLGVVLYLQNRSNRRLLSLNEELRQANQRSEESRLRAEGRVELALNAIDRFREAVADNPEIKLRPELKGLRQKLLRAPQEFYRQLKQDILQGHDTSAGAWTGLAWVILALAQITAEIDSRPRAVQAHHEGLAALDQLLRDRPDVPVFRAVQGRTLFGLGDLQREEGKLGDAISSHERARTILEALIGEQPEVARYRINFAHACDQLGLTYSHSGRLAEAEANFARARETLEGLKNERVEGASHLGTLAVVYNHLGMLFRATHRPDQALKIYQKGLEVQEQLGREQPDDPWARSILATLHYNIGNLQRETRQGDMGASYQQAVKFYEPLVRDYPSIPQFRVNLAQSLGNLAAFTRDDGTGAPVIAAYTRVAELQRSAVVDYPGNVAYVLDLVTTLFNLAQQKTNRGQVDNALRYLNEAAERLDALLARSPDPTGRVRSLLGVAWEKRAEAFLDLKRDDAAIEAYQSAIAHQRRALEQSPQSDAYRGQLLDDYLRLMALQFTLGRTTEAAASIVAMDPLWRDDPDELFSAARQLALGIPRAVQSSGQSPRISSIATESCVALVMTTMERSVRAGFRDFARLTTDPAFQVMRSRDDFQRLLGRMMDLAFPLNPFER
jgi:serine/threonine-protein kinase